MSLALTRKAKLGNAESFHLLDAPGHLLRRNHQRSYEIFTRLVGVDVTRQQVALLVALTQNPGSSQNALVAATGIDKSTMKEMLGRLIKRGWIDRKKDENDNRAWVMNITPKGRAIVDDRIAAVIAAQAEILAPLEPEERPVFLALLRKLIDERD